VQDHLRAGFKRLITGSGVLLLNFDNLA